MENNNNNAVKFPLGIMLVAALVDILGFVGVDLILVRIPYLVAFAVVWIWSFTKGVKKTDPVPRLITASLIEVMPFLGDFSPTWSILVMLTYFKQTHSATSGAAGATVSKLIRPDPLFSQPAASRGASKFLGVKTK